MIQPSAETLWARRRLAQDPRFSHLFRSIPLPGVSDLLACPPEESWESPLAEVVEIFPDAVAGTSATLDARRALGRRPA